MNFLARLLLGIRPDVTRDWPQLAAYTPALDLRNMTIGSLRFGSPIGEARIFGQPDARKGLRGKVDELFYARSGCVLEFKEGKLSYVAYLLGRSEYTPEHEALSFSRPQVTLPDGSVHEFTDELNAETLVSWLGAPESSELTEDASVLEWSIKGMTLEAELDPQSRLKTLNLFPTAR